MIEQVRDWLKAFTHNAVVHPLMMFLPQRLATKVHDRNATWAFGLDRYDEMEIESGKRNETSKPEDGDVWTSPCGEVALEATKLYPPTGKKASKDESSEPQWEAIYD